MWRVRKRGPTGKLPQPAGPHRPEDRGGLLEEAGHANGAHKCNAFKALALVAGMRTGRDVFAHGTARPRSGHLPGRLHGFSPLQPQPQR